MAQPDPTPTVQDIPAGFDMTKGAEERDYWPTEGWRTFAYSMATRFRFIMRSARAGSM